MSASGAYDDRAAVGRRIGEARREQGLTQGELAARIGVPLAILDRYEAGTADVSGTLARIADVTGKPVSWFTSSGPYEAMGPGGNADLQAEIGRRIAESRGRRGLTRRELAEAVGVSLGKIERYESGAESPAGFVERIATVLDEPRSWLETGDRSAPGEHRGGFADAYRRQWDERTRLARQLDELRAELADEQRTHAETAARGAQLVEAMDRVTAETKALSDLLEQSRLELAGSRTHENDLAQRVSRLESDLRVAEERAAELEERLDRAETDLERSREAERTLAEELDVRQAELSVRSAELDTRETAVADAEASVEDRRRALGDVELRAAAMERREEAVRLRASELEHRAGVHDEPARRLDEHLAYAPGHGYRLVVRDGAAPDPGQIVEVDDRPYRCMRVSASPFPGDDRPCAVLEPVTPASGP